MKASKSESIKVIRLDEMPVLFGVIERLKIAALLDEEISRHANWVGALGIGKVVSGWLVYVLSTADHRLNGPAWPLERPLAGHFQVQDWVEQRKEAYATCLQCEVRGLDFSESGPS